MQPDEPDLARHPEDDVLREPGQVDADLRGDVGELGHHIPCARRVDRVGKRVAEAELRGDRARVEAECAAREGARAVRRAGRAGAPVAQALQVAHERPGVRHQVVGQEDRLGVLQVRASRHDRGRMLCGTIGDDADQLRDLRRDRVGMVEQVEPHESCDLVVAAAAGAQLAAELRTKSGHQLALQREVHILIGVTRTDRAVGDPRVDLVDAGEHPLELVGGQEARRGERAGVCARAAQVVGRQLPVEVGRAAQRLELGRGAIREASAPERRAVAVRAHERNRPTVEATSSGTVMACFSSDIVVQSRARDDRGRSNVVP